MPQSPLYRLKDRAGHIHPATERWVIVCTLQRKLKGTVQVLCPRCHSWQPCDDNGICLACQGQEEEEQGAAPAVPVVEKLWWERQLGLSQA